MAAIVQTDDEKKNFPIFHDTLVSEEVYRILVKSGIKMRNIDKKYGYKDLYVIIRDHRPNVELYSDECEDVNSRKIKKQVIDFILTPRYNRSVCIHPITDPSNPAYSPNLTEYGLFAAEDIQKDSVIGLYTGIICTDDEKRLMEVKYKNIPKYLFMVEKSVDKVKKELYIDGYELKCEGACINDCRINENKTREQNVCFASGWEDKVIPFIAVIALQDIKRGEEILGSYGQEYWDRLTESSEYDAAKILEERKKRFEEKQREIDIQRSKKIEAALKIQRMAHEENQLSKANKDLKERCELICSKTKAVSLEMKAIRVVEGDEKYIECPYLTGHTIQKKDIKNHLMRCPDRFNSSIKYDVCPFNNDHIMDMKELKEHIEICPNNPKNIRNYKRKRVEENEKVIDLRNEGETSNIPRILRNLSPSKQMFSPNNKVNNPLKEIVIPELSGDITDDQLNRMIDSLYGLVTEWGIILNKIEKENEIKLETSYRTNDNVFISYVLQLLHRIYDNKDFFSNNYQTIPIDVIHIIIKSEDIAFSNKKNLLDVMHFVSNVFLVDRGLQQLNLQLSDTL